jgi:hypothetical protein
LDSEIRIPRERVLKEEHTFRFRISPQRRQKLSLEGTSTKEHGCQKTRSSRGIKCSFPLRRFFFISPSKFRIQVMRSSTLRWAASAECPIMISVSVKCIRINHRKKDGWEKERGRNMDGNK